MPALPGSWFQCALKRSRFPMKVPQSITQFSRGLLRDGLTRWRGWRCSRRTTAAFVLKPQAPNHNQCFANYMAGHFGMALEAIGKNDWDLDDSEALSPKFMS